MADEIVQKELAHDTSNATIARLANQRTKFRAATAKMTGERDAARTEAAQLKLDLAEARKHEGATAELATLKAQVKLDKHRGVFDQIAKSEGANPKALDDLWEKSGYKSLNDVPDQEAIKAAITKQKVDRDYLFGSGSEGAADDDEDGEDDGPTVPQLEQARPGPARGQGGTKRSTGGQTQISDAQMRDPAWCYANAGKIQAAAKAAADLPIGAVGSKFAIG